MCTECGLTGRHQRIRVQQVESHWPKGGQAGQGRSRPWSVPGILRINASRRANSMQRSILAAHRAGYRIGGSASIFLAAVTGSSAARSLVSLSGVSICFFPPCKRRGDFFSVSYKWNGHVPTFRMIITFTISWWFSDWACNRYRSDYSLEHGSIEDDGSQEWKSASFDRIVTAGSHHLMNEAHRVSPSFCSPLSVARQKRWSVLAGIALLLPKLVHVGLFSLAVTSAPIFDPRLALYAFQSPPSFCLDFPSLCGIFGYECASRMNDSSFHFSTSPIAVYVTRKNSCSPKPNSSLANQAGIMDISNL